MTSSISADSGQRYELLEMMSQGPVFLGLFPKVFERPYYPEDVCRIEGVLREAVQLFSGEEALEKLEDSPPEDGPLGQLKALAEHVEVCLLNRRLNPSIVQRVSNLFETPFNELRERFGLPRETYVESPADRYQAMEMLCQKPEFRALFPNGFRTPYNVRELEQMDRALQEAYCIMYGNEELKNQLESMASSPADRPTQFRLAMLAFQVKEAFRIGPAKLPEQVYLQLENIFKDSIKNIQLRLAQNEIYHAGRVHGALAKHERAKEGPAEPFSVVAPTPYGNFGVTMTKDGTPLLISEPRK